MSASFAAGLAAALPAVIDTVADFRRELAARLPGPVIVQSGQVSLISEGSAVLRLEEADGGCVMVKIEVLFVSAWLRPVTDGTVWANKADELVGVVLTMLDRLTGALGATSYRNAVDPSGTTDVRMRPDYWLLVLGALLLKAEHKRSRSELGDAKAELASKMKGWNAVALSGLAFLPCFAVGGEQLQFCAVVRNADGSLAVEDASPVFNMNVDLDRLRIVCAACNMFRVLVALRRRMPAKVPPLYTAQVRPCGTSITVMDDHVVKKCWPAPDGVYACLEGEGSIPCAIRVTSRITPAGGGMTHIKMEPVCVEALPDSEADLQVRGWVGLLSHRACYRGALASAPRCSALYAACFEPSALFMLAALCTATCAGRTSCATPLTAARCSLTLSSQPLRASRCPSSFAARPRCLPRRVEAGPTLPPGTCGRLASSCRRGRGSRDSEGRDFCPLLSPSLRGSHQMIPRCAPLLTRQWIMRG